MRSNCFCGCNHEQFASKSPGKTLGFSCRPKVILTTVKELGSAFYASHEKWSTSKACDDQPCPSLPSTSSNFFPFVCKTRISMNFREVFSYQTYTLL